MADELVAAADQAQAKLRMEFPGQVPDLWPDFIHQEPDGIDIGVVFEIGRKDQPQIFPGLMGLRHNDTGQRIRIHLNAGLGRSFAGELGIVLGRG